MVLCKLASGRSVAESLGQDHIFVGVQSRPRDEMPHKLIKCVLEFIDVASGKPDRLVSVGRRPHTGHVGLYGPKVEVAVEIGPVVQDMALSETEINTKLLVALRKWCDLHESQL